MTTLVLETTLPTPTIGLVLANGEVLQKTFETPRMSAQLLPAVKQLLADAAQTPQTLTNIVLTRGPGSFTGARVGLAFAQGLQAATQAHVATLTTLQAIALSHPVAEPVTVLIDSLGQELFCQSFDAQKQPADAPQCLLPQELTLPPNTIILGNGAEKAGMTNAKSQPTSIDIQALAHHVQQGSDPLTPLYLKLLNYRKIVG